MTITSIYNLHCAECPEHAYIEASSVKQARITARIGGWQQWRPHYLGKLIDLCPQCWEKRRGKTNEH